MGGLAALLVVGRGDQRVSLCPGSWPVVSLAPSGGARDTARTLVMVHSLGAPVLALSKRLERTLSLIAGLPTGRDNKNRGAGAGLQLLRAKAAAGRLLQARG